MGKYTKKDAAKDTNSSTREVSRAWHQADDDAAGSGELDQRNESKVSDSETGRAIWDWLTGK